MNHFLNRKKHSSLIHERDPPCSQSAQMWELAFLKVERVPHCDVGLELTRITAVYLALQAFCDLLKLEVTLI